MHYLGAKESEKKPYRPRFGSQGRRRRPGLFWVYIGLVYKLFLVRAYTLIHFCYDDDYY